MPYVFDSFLYPAVTGPNILLKTSLSIAVYIVSIQDEHSLLRQLVPREILM
jgi:hypothetical protein